MKNDLSSISSVSLSSPWSAPPSRRFPNLMKYAQVQNNRANSGGMEIKKAFDTFIEQQKNMKMLRPETIRGYNSVLSNLLKNVPEIKTTNDLTPENIVKMFQRLQARERRVGKEMKKTGIKKSTVFTYQRKLNPFFNWLLNEGILLNNPLNRMSKVSQPVYEDIRALTKDQVDKIITAIIVHPEKIPAVQKRDILMFYLLSFCGLRSGELRLLEIRDFDLDKKILTVRGEASKSKKNRKIPLHHLVVTAYNDYLKERAETRYKTPKLLISSNRDAGLSGGGLKHWSERLEKLAGFDFHLHQFRHTFACNLARENVHIAKIQKLLGHSDLKMTQKYLRSLMPEDMKDEINKLSID